MSLDVVTLGYGTLFDARHRPVATRLTVHPQDAGPPRAAELLASLAEAWPADRGPLWLNLTSEPWLRELLKAEAPAHLLVEVPAFLAAEPELALPGAGLVGRPGVSRVLTGRPMEPLAPEVLAGFGQALLEAGDAAAASAAGRLPFVQAGSANVAEVQRAFAHGARGVLGWPVGDSPEGTQSARPVPAGARVVMDLMQRVERGEPVSRLEESLRGDPTLAFKLMRFINSPGFGLPVEVGSFQHAIMLLGYQRLKRWLALLLTSAVDDPALKPLMFMAVCRGLLMEALARRTEEPGTQSELFICGVFSLLDRMLGQPFAKLVEALPVPEHVASALVSGEGPHAPYLELACAIESASPIDIRSAMERMMTTPGEVNEAVLHALSTARQMQAD